MNLFKVQFMWKILLSLNFILLPTYYLYSDNNDSTREISTKEKFWYHFVFQDPTNNVTTNVIVHRFYLEDRSENNAHVRAYLILDARRNLNKPFCHFYFEHSSVQVPGYVYPLIVMPFEANKILYYTYIVKCPIKDFWMLRSTLKFVSLHGTEEYEKIPVVIPENRTGSVNDSIALCLAPQYGTVTDKLYAPYLVQWIEMLKMLGVSKISWYNATFNSDGIYTNKVLNYYADTGILNLVQMPIPVKYNKSIRFPLHVIPTGEGQAIEVTRLAIINDCFYRDIRKFWYFIHSDKDELMVPYQKAQTYQSYLRSLIDKQKTPKQRDDLINAQTLAVPSAFFYLSNKKNRANVPDYFPILKYTYRQPTEPHDRTPGYSKAFINPRSCDSYWNHRCFHGAHVYLPEHEIQIHHYRYKCYVHIDRDIRRRGHNCTTEHQRHFEDTSIDLYADVLKQRTTHVLKKINFI